MITPGVNEKFAREQRNNKHLYSEGGGRYGAQKLLGVQELLQISRRPSVSGTRRVPSDDPPAAGRRARRNKRGQGLLGGSRLSVRGKGPRTYAEKLNDCWRCDFMNAVKKEEEPAQFGFSHTRLGIEKTLQKYFNNH